MELLDLFLLVLAVENAADILTGVDLLSGFRNWFTALFPRFGKIAICKYCQTFWLTPLFFFVLPKWVWIWFAVHRLAILLAEFAERYLGRSPISIFVQQPTAPEVVPDSESSEK